MARTRKAQKVKENQITMTQASFDELSKELAYRKDVLRLEIAEEIAAARELGDLSENHAYTVAMDKKEMNENRINELESILALVFIVEETEKTSGDNFVNVGESVEIENTLNKQKRVVTLVGSEESKSANPTEGKISTDSPIGKAILNAKIGDVVEVILPNGQTHQYKLTKFAKAA
ncbi:Transcription elongation factor GreA [Candidatus Brocadiaceae bacterium]|nr:Transcription elongation factor GreA [Candidatus Brocadiaceae bacterium]